LMADVVLVELQGAPRELGRLKAVVELEVPGAADGGPRHPGLAGCVATKLQPATSATNPIPRPIIRYELPTGPALFKAA
jgi:hypothetical protein